MRPATDPTIKTAIGPAAARSPDELARLQQRLYQVGRPDTFSKPAQATGYAQLDNALPGGGLPIGAVTEIMLSTAGCGELRLVMSALAEIARERYLGLVEPPYLPYPPAWAQHGVPLERLIVIRNISHTLSLWSSEQMLRCSAFGAVLCWPSSIHDKEIRRLQLAAEASNSLAIVYRPIEAARQASPAALRLLLRADKELHVEIKKCRGGQAGRIITCNFN